MDFVNPPDKTIEKTAMLHRSESFGGQGKATDLLPFAYLFNSTLTKPNKGLKIGGV
jgi:hypothetical protein